MKTTYYLGMEPRWLAHIFGIWYDSRLDFELKVFRSAKSDDLVIVAITVDKKDFEAAAIINKMWTSTGCRITSKEHQ